MSGPLGAAEPYRSESRIWLTRYLTLQRKYDRTLETLLKTAAADADSALANLRDTGTGQAVRQAQLMAAATAIRNALATLWASTEKLISDGRADAGALALKNSADWDEKLLRLEMTREQFRAMRNSLLSAGQFNVEAALSRLTTSYRPLSARVWRSAALTDGWLDRTIDSALARGANRDELRKAVKDFVRPDVPGGVAYAAKRLARTEINNAYHAVTIAHNEDKPWNLGMQWSLSRSHPQLDICDEYGRMDSHGLGPGVYPKTDVPAKPHPQCLCVIYPVTMSPDDFVAAYRNGKFSEYIETTYR